MADYPMVLPVIYVAGPYRAATPRRVVANITRAQDAALAVWKMGAVALCPHSNAYLFDGEAEEEVWLRGDLELLRRSDAILMVGNWPESHGAKQEHQAAVDVGMPVFYDTALSVLRIWVEDWKRGAKV